MTGHLISPYQHAGRGDGAHDDAPALNACADQLRAECGGLMELPRGKWRLDNAWDVRRWNRVRVVGDGVGVSIIEASEAFDGSDGIHLNDLVYGVNGLPTDTGGHGDTATFTTDAGGRACVTGHPEKYYSGISFERITFDMRRASFLSQPITAGYGLSGACVEITDTHDVSFVDCEFIGGIANGAVIASMDPAVGSFVSGARFIRCSFVDCVREGLPTYGRKVTGSVIQIGAARDGEVTACRAYASGGPFLDVFQASAVHATWNHIEGVQDVAGMAPGAAVRYQGFIKGDFNWGASRIMFNTFINSGSIALYPKPAMFQTAWQPAPGPRGMRVQFNDVFGLAQSNIDAGLGRAPVLVGADGADVSNADGNVTRDNQISS